MVEKPEVGRTSFDVSSIKDTVMATRVFPLPYGWLDKVAPEKWAADVP